MPFDGVPPKPHTKPRFRLTRKGFIEWLEGQPHDRVLCTYDPEDDAREVTCPIAQYLTANGERVWYVGVSRFKTERMHYGQELSPWMRKFVGRVDAEFCAEGDFNTVGDCLRILRGEK